MEEQTNSQLVPVEDLRIDTLASTDLTTTTIYHIYHTGKGKRPPNYSIHSIRDSETTILAPIKKTSEEKAKAKVQKKKAKAEKKDRVKSSDSTPALEISPTADLVNTSKDTTNTTTDLANINSDPNTVERKPLKGLKKLPKLDHPDHDPRTATAPYFLHLPKLAGKEPPYTLRYTGIKGGPVAAILTPLSIWSGWKLEFGDVLLKEGVVDGRGVVGIRYGVKDLKKCLQGTDEEGEGGLLKGYKMGKRRWWGASGKEYYNQQREAGFPGNVEVAMEEKARVEDVVRLKWVGLWKLGRVREYGFEWRGYEFCWKGTRQVESKKGHKMWVWCNHLKLVVKMKGEEVGLARYCCVLGNRKAGRLEVNDGAVEKLLRECASEEEKTRQRLKDVVVGTMICMLITERNKRRWLLELLQEVGENAGG